MGTVSSSSALVLRDSDWIRFVPDGVAGEQGNLTFVAWDQTDGATAGTKVNATTTGGTTAFSDEVGVARITVTEVNDAPSGTNNTIIVLEDDSYTFAASDFGFSDVDGDTFTRVYIDALPTNGQLLYNGSTFAAGNWISVSDLASGLLTFEPATGANGNSYDNFQFSVYDDGGNANGGVNRDQTPNTVTVDVTTAYRIEGNIVEDVNGDSSLADAVGASGATVYLYQDADDDNAISAGDTLFATTTTDVAGFYSFTSLLDDTYFVVVDSRTIAPSAGQNATFSQTDVWAEQTYGVAGAASGVSFQLANGSLFGGRAADVSDDASSLLTAEHVTRVTVSGADTANIDSGFSFNVVTGVRDGDDVGAENRSVQGSLRQFVDNANAIAGANAMRFVPGVATNTTDGGGENWWTISLGSSLATLSDSGTTIDGTAYDFADGVTILNSNAGDVNIARTVGVDALTLDAVERQELQVDFGGSVNGIEIDAGNATISDIALIGQDGSGATIRVSENVLSGSEATIQRTIIGANADGTDPGTDSGFRGMNVDGAAVIENNFIAFLDGAGVRFNGLANGNSSAVTFTNNEVAFVGGTHSAGDAITVDSTSVTVQGNYIHDVAILASVHPYNGKGIELWYNANNNLIDNNTVVGGVTAGIGLGANASNNTVSKNIITGTTGSGGDGGAGILITNAGGNPTGNILTENSIYANAGIGIDIDSDITFTTAFGDGQNANDGDLTPTSANQLIDHPIIETANLVGGSLTLAGYVGAAAGDTDFANARIEFFESDGSDEGERYLGFLTTDASGNYSGTLTVTGVVDADSIVATATMTGIGTSEFGNAFGVNVTPSDLNPNAVSIDENTDTSSGVTVATLLTSDNDSGDTATYTVVGGADAGVFSISGDSLILTDGVLDFETQSSYTVRVRTTDSGGLYREEDIVVSVNDLNEAPEVNGPATATVTESQSITFNAAGAGLIDTFDVDGDNLTVTLTANHASIALAQTTGLTLIDGDGSDGTLQFSGTQVNIDAALDGLEYDSQAGYNGSASLIILVDDGSLTDSTTVAITVNPGQTTFVWDGGGTTDDWTDAANWDHDLVPEADDIVVFNATSTKASTVDASFVGSISQINVTADYTNTITQARDLNVTGDMTFLGTTFNVFGATLDVDGDFVVTDLRSGGGDLFFGGDYTHTGGANNFSGTWTFDSADAQTIDIARTIASVNFASGNTATFTSDLALTGDLIHSSGNVDFGGNRVTLQGSTAETVDATGLVFDDVTINSTSGVNVVGDWNIDGDLLINSVTNISGQDLLVAGDINIQDTDWTGSSALELNGTANQTVSGANGYNVTHLVINKTTGTTTLDGGMSLRGNLLHLGGTVDASTLDLAIIGSNNGMVHGSIGPIDTLTINNSGIRNTSGTLEITNDFTLLNAGTLDNGALLALGDVTLTDTNYTGTTEMQFGGVADQTVTTTSANALLRNAFISKTGGTLTFAGDHRVTGSFTHAAGNTDFTVVKTDFESAGLLLDTDGITFGDVEFSNNANFTLVSDMTVGGDFSITGIAGNNSGADIYVAGNVSSTDATVVGDFGLVLNGTGDQTISGGDLTDGTLTIDKASGSAILADDLDLNGTGQNVNVNSGALDLAGYALTTTGTVLIDGAILIGGGTITNDLYFQNIGVLELDVDSTSVFETLDVGGTLTLASERLRLDVGDVTIGGLVDDLVTYGTLVGTWDGVELTNNGLKNFTSFVENNADNMDLFLNTPPTGTIADFSVNEDAPDTVIDLAAAFGDEEHTDGQIIYTIQNNTNPTLVDLTLDNSGDTLTLDYTANLNGSATITVRGTDPRGQYVDVVFTVTVDSVNDAPVAADGINTAIEDGASVNGTVSATDNDPGDTLTYSLFTNTGEGNVVVNGDGSYTFDPGSDFQDLAAGETRDVTFVFRATDDGVGTLSDDATVTITVTGTNDQPTISVVDVAGAVTEDASTPNLTDSGSVTFAEVDDTDVLNSSVALSGTSTTGPAIPAGLSTALNSAMSLTQTGTNDGTIDWDFTVANSLTQYLADGETVTATYTITLADDSGTGNNTTTQNVTVVITGNNDQPTITVVDVVGAVTEDAATPNLTDTGSVTFAEVDDSDALTSSAALSGTSTTGPAIPSGLSTALASALSLTQTGTNDGAIDWDFTVANSLTQYLADGETVTATYTIALTDDSGTGNNTATQNVTVIITGTNDAPIVAVNNGVTVLEGSTGTQVTTSMLNEGDVDDDGADLTYTITSATSNGTLFRSGFGALGAGDTFTQDDIDSGRVTYDHDGTETTSDGFSFSLADGGENGAAPATGTFNITITPVNDNSTTAINDTDIATDIVLENSSVGTTVGITAFADDVDAGDTITYSLDDNDGGRFKIDSATGVVTVDGAIDRELDGPTRTIVVRATSTDTSTTTRSFNITISDADEFDVSTPTDSDTATNEVDENVVSGTSVGITADAFDLDATNNTITYSLTSNPDGLFQIDPSTGEVTTLAAIDREIHGATRSITVQAASSDGSTATQSFNITVNDLDEFDTTATIDIDASANQISENAGIGTLVGITASASDADATNNTITYSLDDNDGGRFQIDPNTGIVTVGVPTDREADGPIRTITVRATSSDLSFSTENYDIAIVDVDEFDTSAVVDTDASPNEIAENSAIGSTVGLTAAAFDADATNSAVTYTLDDDAGGRFVIDITTGVVTTAASLDFESFTPHSITVRATSADGSSSTASFTIDVLDRNEAPVALDDDFTTTASTTTTLSVTEIVSNDTDVDGDSLSVSIVSGPTNGSLTVDASGNLVYKPNSGFFGVDTITYQATDGSLLSNVATIQIDVQAVPPIDPVDPVDPVDPEDPDDGPDDTEEPTEETEDPSTEPADETNSGTPTPTGATSPANEETSNGNDSQTTSLSGIASANSITQVDQLVAAEIANRDLLMIFSDQSFVSLDFSNMATEFDRLLQLDIQQAIVWHAWDDAREEVEQGTYNFIVGSAASAAGLISVGYLFWGLRLGAFMAAFSTSIPSWRLIDPTTLLTAYRDSTYGKDQSIEEIL
ncbi:MAG: cadherin domain-containing protein [Pirellulaceae bacterium]